MTDLLATLPLAARDVVHAAIKARMHRVARFASARSHALASPALRRPHTLESWAALTPAVRLAHLRAKVVASEVRHYREAGASAPVPAAPSAPETPTAKVVPAGSYATSHASLGAATSRYWVSCAGSCGAMLPARSGRPVLVRCETCARGRRK